MTVIVAEINLDLKEVCERSASNGLGLNISKCTALHIAPEQLVQALRVLTVSRTVRIVSVILDDKLTFSGHFTQNILKALGSLRRTYRVRGLLPEPAKLRLVQALIRSNCQYCYPAYGNSISREDTERIQKMQNTTIHFV